MKDRVLSVLLLSIVLIIVSCSSSPVTPEQPTTDAYSMVYDYDNRPVPDVEVSIDGVIRAKTDINGRCMISGMDPGKYEILFKKTDYEDAKTTFVFGDVGRVLYIKIISSAQLLSEAEKELSQRHWSEARAFINRVLAMHPSHPSARYLDAVLRFRTGDVKGAESLLLALLEDDYREPHVLLFLADVEQYRLENLVKARVQLVEYLRLRYDPDIEQRLQALTQEMENRQPHGVSSSTSDASSFH